MLYPVTYARLLARELRLDRQGQIDLLTGSGLNPEDLVALDQLMSEHDHTTIIRNALRLSGRSGLGLELGSTLSLAAHGPLGQLLSSSPTLDDAWAALERFHALRVPMVQLIREFKPGYLVIRLVLRAPHDDVALFLLEALVVTIQRGIELIIGRRLRDGMLELAYPAPAHAELYSLYLHSPFHFAAGQTAWHIPLQLLEQPNPFRDALFYQQTLKQCEQLEQTLKSGETTDWSARISYLLQQHPGHLWSLIDMAKHLNVSSRTLIRHLKAEGSSYQGLLDQELSQQALEYFNSAQSHSVESVALALGYQDATAFRRAFKRWFGASPKVFMAATKADR